MSEVEQFTLPGIPRKPGRPKTSPLSRAEQSRLIQQKKKAANRAAGMRQLSTWLPGFILDQLDALAAAKTLSRERFLVELLARVLPPELAALKPTKKRLR